MSRHEAEGCAMGCPGNIEGCAAETFLHGAEAAAVERPGVPPAGGRRLKASVRGASPPPHRQRRRGAAAARRTRAERSSQRWSEASLETLCGAR
jgi:hypothetical protein